MSLLRDEAYQWWLTMREGIQADHLTWDFFKAAFLGKYVGASYVDARRKEFLNLTQGSNTVAEYEVKFLRLNRYVLGIVTTEYERCVWFEDGLRDELHMVIALQGERDFATPVEKVKIAEDVKHSEHQNREKDRGRNRSLVLIVEELTRVSAGNKPGRALDREVVSSGHGQARDGNGLGRGCGTTGRGVGSTEARQPALVYTACHREDGDALDVIKGMFLIYNVPYTALIDIGSTHSYVTCTVSEKLGILFENTVSEMIVLSPLG
ncbi:uncharacterized protein [Gossypium hirsutum]|uniref:Retrotransposon gag domain-containing protein n=1 Tax=Gossypium hirsutum TaxID=3635 RepID=A0A1U8PQ72_GOSHI|nr:uncharacterized protein LOC107960568 [Gossypium hirsutum]